MLFFVCFEKMDFYDFCILGALRKNGRLWVPASYAGEGVHAPDK